MTVEEIRASGLLELYVLGQLTVREQELVWEHLVAFPALKKDLQEIERAAENFAQAAALQAPASLKQRILDEIGNTTSLPVKPVERNSGWRIAAIIATLIALGLFFLLLQKSRQLTVIEGRLEIVIDSCNQQNQQSLAQITTLQQLTLQDNEILHMTGTPKYPETDLYFHHNPVTQRNFIQVRSMPALAANQSFQLWSLKPNIAPIPLDVFQPPDTQIIEVRYEGATQSYAITIEPLGGQNSPTLENLIGIINVGE
ncbi:MAG TPA: anti-sigma factor [Saprospiraceae bacterium]|nr:anti-sigma factor [Saprospiraceae bacterium]